MKTIAFIISILVFSPILFAQEVAVDIKLTPAGSFKAKTNDIKGFAEVKGDQVSAKNIIVNLQSLKTGVELRDVHTKKHLEADKFPQAILVSASGKGGKGEGILRVRGIDQKVSGTYTVSGKTLHADFMVKLSDYKITGIKYMGIGVNDVAKLSVTVPVK